MNERVPLAGLFLYLLWETKYRKNCVQYSRLTVLVLVCRTGISITCILWRTNQIAKKACKFKIRAQSCRTGFSTIFPIGRKACKFKFRAKFLLVENRVNFLIGWKNLHALFLCLVSYRGIGNKPSRTTLSITTDKLIISLYFRYSMYSSLIYWY